MGSFVSIARVGAALLWLVAISAARAHAQSATGEVQGTVVDQSGAVLPGVAITNTNTATGATRETVTDASGLFAFPGLPVGPYELTAALQGFAPRRQQDDPCLGNRDHVGDERNQEQEAQHRPARNRPACCDCEGQST